MNKKLLLSTTIAGTMFIAGMANPSLAATEVRTTRNWVEANTLSLAVELDMGDRDLSREELVRILNDRFYENCLESVETQSDGTVATGAKIKLTDGKELTLVLFGDPDGDGKITARDAQAILLDRAGSKTLETGAARKAGDVVNPDGLRAQDAQRILKYIADPSSLGSRYVDPERIPNDDILEVLGFSAAFGSTTTNAEIENAAAIKMADIKINGNDIDIYIERNNIKQDYVDAEIGKWLDIQIDLPQGSWSIAGGVKSRTGTKAEKAEGKPIITVNTVNDKTTFTLIFNGEEVTVNVNIHDISQPTYKKLSEVKETTSNNKEVTKWEETDKENHTTYAIEGNTNKMDVSAKALKYYDSAAKKVEAKEVTGAWYKVKAEISGIDADNVVAYDVTDKVMYDVEKINDTELYVWLNAEKASTKIKFINKDSTPAQLAAATATDATVTFTNLGKLKVKAVAVASPYDTGATDSPQNINQSATTGISSVTKSGNKITVKGKLNQMKAYTQKSDGTYTPVKSGSKYVETGKKYYALVVDLGSLTNEYLHSDADTDTLLKLTKANDTDNKLNKYYISPSVTSGTPVADHSILLWLDADEPTTTIAVRGTTDASKEYESEYFRFTVDFVDTSAPDVLPFETNKRNPVADGEKAFDNNSVKVVSNDALAVNAKAVAIDNVTDKNKDKTQKETDIVINARQSAMTRIAGPDGSTSVWYALVVDTNVNRSELQFETFNGTDLTVGNKQKPCDDYVSGIEGLAKDEIVLWIDANELNANSGTKDSTFIISNKNDAANTKWTIKVTTKEYSYVKVTLIDKAKGLNDEAQIANSGFYSSPDIAKAIKNNVKDGVADVSEDTLPADKFTGEMGLANGKLYILKANSNKLMSFNHPTFGTGTWVPLIATISASIDVTSAIVNGSENRLATPAEYNALGLNTARQLLIWVNTAELKEKKNNKVVLTTAGVEEQHIFYFNYRNSAAFPAEKEESTEPASGYEFESMNPNWETEYVPDIREHFTTAGWTDKDASKYLFNQELVKVTSERKDNVVTVTLTGDFNNMFPVKSNASSKIDDGRLVTYILDLGIPVDVTYQEATFSETTKDSLTVDEILNRATTAGYNPLDDDDIKQGQEDYGCTETQLYKNTFLSSDFKDGGHANPGWFRTRYWVYSGTDTDNSDKLIFEVRFVQQGLNDDDLLELLEFYGLEDENKTRS